MPTTSLSPARVRLALLALALGGFAIGSTEFVAMGLLPNIAADLFPGLYGESPAHANASAGLLVSAYALGVVVGAPTIAALSARFPRKKLLLSLLVAFTVATVASALLPSFGGVLVARFIAGLPHGAYFGIAALVAASLMGPGNRGKGIAFVLGGLTIANVLGVPTITLLGQLAGWRVAYLAVAGLFALTFVAVLLAVPLQPGDPNATLRRELSIFRRGQVWFALAIGSIGFGGFFAVYTYVAPIIVTVAGLGAGIVPLALILVGVGMTIGNAVGGHLADVSLVRSMFGFFGLLAVSLAGVALTATTVPGLAIFLFLLGFSAAGLSPMIQTRLMDVAGEGQSLAAAINHASLNLGNSAGAFIGGLAVTSGLGYLGAPWIGLVLCALGVIIATVSIGLDRRASERAAGQIRLQQDAVLDRALS
ncbi:MFS transporter [Galbitalea soli]|uniref:MFS transporter n=1 Tax=Galbitalea soli TaxID=1268042 RepID=A0A7C9PM30_9MICO|nr:MFS transporter [Galbitalea soli]NEM90507.1 MFS transporter [Galbitalea soli]NYJ31220.1 DHA1 family inner membrane transport protein [Galbitalea soli]